MSQITTHILDTTKGQPASGVTIMLYQQQAAGWREISQGQTNTDGRMAGLLDPATILEPGIYKMKFLTQEYFDREAVPAFYPFVEIVFTVATREHYHIPLLLNPFGYTTYRGS
jgi:5-hydroxyisourate hydrolase